MNYSQSNRIGTTSQETIRAEITRFEGVHPAIYSIYELLEHIGDGLLAQQVRDQVMHIEDSFVNSQEWTLARNVHDLKIGIIGSEKSGKSALVHRYLTGTYLHEESPEGGRFKKEVVVGGRSYLLLIRDEAGSPEMQFAYWLDALILVIALDHKSSVDSVKQMFHKIMNYRRKERNQMDEYLPVLLVGTLDQSTDRHRVVDDNMINLLRNEFGNCRYFETCSTYGLNVERVFNEACSMIVECRYSRKAINGPPVAMTQTSPTKFYLPPHEVTQYVRPPAHSHPHSVSPQNHDQHISRAAYHYSQPPPTGAPQMLQQIAKAPAAPAGMPYYANQGLTSPSDKAKSLPGRSLHLMPNVVNVNQNLSEFNGANSMQQALQHAVDNTTPTSTPQLQRKNKRRSVFSNKKRHDDHLSHDSQLSLTFEGLGQGSRFLASKVCYLNAAPKASRALPWA